MANEIANKLNEAQLYQNELILAAMYKHFGLQVERTTGNLIEIPGKSTRKLPEFAGKEVIIKEKNYYHKVFCNVAGPVNFFKVQQAGAITAAINLPYLVMPNNVCFVITGISVTEALNAVQVVGDAPQSLDMGAIVTNQVENARLTMEINKKKVIEDEQLTHLVRNNDAIPNYYRFQDIKVVEPSAGFEISVEFDTAAAKWLEVAVKGYLIEAV